MKICSENEVTTEKQPAGTVSPRLVKAAQEFEAQMMKELLEPMTGQDDFAVESSNASGDGEAVGALGEFASEALGKAISSRGGFGIADRVVHELSRPGHLNQHGNA